MSNVLKTQAPAGLCFTLQAQEGLTSVISEPSDIPEPVTSHLVFVSGTFGSDTTGDGTMTAPYATIEHALTTITTASSVSPWQVFVLPGTYSDSVDLKPWVAIIGCDAQSVTLTGSVQLAAAFGSATAWLSNCLYLGAPLTLDYVFAASTDGGISFSRVTFANDVSLVCNADNETTLDDCILEGACTQLAGTMTWHRTIGVGTGLLRVAPTAGGLSAVARLFDSTWRGSVHADNNAIAAAGVIARIDAFGTELGPLSITSVATNVPIINVELGASPANPTLAGSVSAALSPEMRISLELTAPDTTLAASAVTDITIPLTAGILGATSIEDLHWTFSPYGAAWRALTTAQVIWSWYVRLNLGTNEIHLALLNLDVETQSGVLSFRVSGYLPVPPA